MAYSNGYNNTKVLPALFGRLAWSDATLNAANTTSKSGRKFDDGSFHSLVTASNVKATSPDQADWNIFFTQKQNAVISKCLNAVFNENEFLEQSVLYNRLSEQETSVTNSGKAVGYRFKIARSFDHAVQINSLELYFDSAQTFNVYLFKQGSNTPVKTKSVTTVANEKTTVDLADWILSYRESQVYYIVYFQNDLAATRAIQEQAWFNRANHFSVDSFLTATTVNVFDRVSLPITRAPHGLNMQVSVFRDFTQNILNQPHLFDELLGLVLAYQVLEDVVYSVRSNGTERILKDQIEKVGLVLDLNGVAPISDSPQVIGLKQRIDREMKRVKNSFYPKNKSRTINLAAC